MQKQQQMAYVQVLADVAELLGDLIGAADDDVAFLEDVALARGRANS